MVPKAGASADRALSLPVLVSGAADVGRLARELEKIDDALLQLGLRAGGGEVKMLRTSRLMDQLVQLNRLNLLHADDRLLLQGFLSAVLARAPVLHISFGADPSPAFTEKLMVWLRQEIHPELLLSIGLQSNLGAGCVVRTTNKYFDFSLRQNFAQKRALLLAALAPTEAAP